MAQIQEKDTGGGKKGKQKKIRIHVDFTPMVDMNMLLICFFMLATSMSKPQTMEIVMPAKKTQVKPGDETEVPAARMVTVLLGGANKLYYFEGDPAKIDPKTVGFWQVLKETSYDSDGFRAYLMGRNTNVVNQLKELRNARDSIQAQTKNLQKQITDLKEHAITLIAKNKGGIDAELQNRMDSLAVVAYAKGEGSLMEGYSKFATEIKRSDNTSPIVVIKATDAATYENLVDILDEMQISGISSYAISEITQSDKDLITIFESKGAVIKSATP